MTRFINPQMRRLRQMLQQLLIARRQGLRNLLRGLAEHPTRKIQTYDLFEELLDGAVGHVTRAIHKSDSGGHIRSQQAARAHFVRFAGDVNPVCSQVAVF